MTIGTVVAIALFWSSGEESRLKKALHLGHQQTQDIGNEVAVPSTNVSTDFFRQKYSLEQRAEFHVTSSEPIAIFVFSTGVEVRTDSGWKPFSEEPRGEIWRLKPGAAQEMFVERPTKDMQQIWRAYVRYGTEIRGLPLLKAQLREAWQIRSLKNWTGKSWGGGRFSGSNDLFSQELSE